MSFICIAVVLCLVPDLSSAEFTVVPMTLNVTAGEPAVFTCRHSSTNFIAWTVNGVSAQSTNVTMSGVSVAGDTLTILALPENNGTVVECVAFFLDGSPPASTPPVVLIVQGNCNSTVAIAFIEEPQSQNVAIGETAQFRCRHPTADYIGWTLNGSSTTNNTNNVSTKTVSLPGHNHDGQPRYILLIGAIPTYQGTIVICVARFINNCDSQDSAPAVLLIQGPLEAVSNIIRGLISDSTFSWDPPRSLDLTNVEPDVAYYVTIHNITCGKNDLLVEDHTVLDTYFMSSTIIPDSVYRIKVVPRSNVENAVNGTPLILEEEFIDYQVSQIHFIINSGANNLTATIEFTPNMTVPGHRIIPSKYKVIMTTNDGQEIYTVEPSISGTPSTDGLNLTFLLTTRRLWKYDILAHNCRQHSIGSGTISSYELQTSTTTPQPRKIEVTGEFVDQSTTKGVLIIVYPFGSISNSDVHYVYHKPKNNYVHVPVAGLNGSQYGVSVFIVEEDGLPFPRVANIPKMIQFNSSTKGNGVNQPSIEYSLQSTSTGVCITCTFLDSSVTDCVAVVHQRISQLSSSGLMNIESSHKLTRSGNTASGCIEGVNMEDYQVGVINGTALEDDVDELRNSPNMVPTTIIIISVIMPVLVIVVIIIVVIIVIVIVRRRRHGNGALTNASQEEESDLNMTEYRYRVTDNMGYGPANTEHSESQSDSLGTESQLNTEDTSTNRWTEPSVETRRSIVTRNIRRGVQQNEEVAVEPAEINNANRPFPLGTSADITRSNSENLMYVEPVSPTSTAVTSPPPTAETGQHYAMVGLFTSEITPDDLKTVYSEILPHSRGSTTAALGVEPDTSTEINTEGINIETHTDPPFTVEHIFPHLLSLASKWQALGEALSLDEDCLDEIFTNNETDEACLHEMLEHYMKRSDLKHSWEEVREARRKVEEKDGETGELDSTSATLWSSPAKNHPNSDGTHPYLIKSENLDGDDRHDLITNVPHEEQSVEHHSQYTSHIVHPTQDNSNSEDIHTEDSGRTGMNELFTSQLNVPCDFSPQVFVGIEEAI